MFVNGVYRRHFLVTAHLYMLDILPPPHSLFSKMAGIEIT